MKVKSTECPDEQQTIAVTSKVSPKVIEKINEFARKTKRTKSASVFFLLETHPEIQKLMNIETNAQKN